MLSCARRIPHRPRRQPAAASPIERLASPDGFLIFPCVKTRQLLSRRPRLTFSKASSSEASSAEREHGRPRSRRPRSRLSRLALSRRPRCLSLGADILKRPNSADRPNAHSVKTNTREGQPQVQSTPNSVSSNPRLRSTLGRGQLLVKVEAVL